MVSAVKEACVLVATVLVNAVIALVLLCLTTQGDRHPKRGPLDSAVRRRVRHSVPRRETVDDQARLALLEDSGHWFFPFGIKDYRLRQLYQPHAADPPRRARIRRAVAVTARTLFSARRLVLGSMVILVLCNVSRSVSPPRRPSSCSWRLPS